MMSRVGTNLNESKGGGRGFADQTIIYLQITSSVSGKALATQWSVNDLEPLITLKGLGGGDR
jgi:hypothetical protein